LTDPAHGCAGASCGACSVAHATATCTNMSCGVGTCDTGYGDCDMSAANGCETALASNHDHCGACTTACSGSQVCSLGACVAQCTGGLSDCNGSCVNINNDPQHCGSCNFPCPVPTGGVATCTAKVCGVACSAGYHACGNVCADDTSVNSCGTSCTPCPVPSNGVSTCINGACGIACLPGYQACGNTCVNTTCNPDAGAGDSGMDSGTVTLPGTQLRQGNDLSIWAITSDGYVVYLDHTTSTLNAVSIHGGQPQTISSSLGPSFTVVASNHVAFVWTNLNAQNVGQLLVWSAATGAHSVSAASAAGFGLAAADASSSYIVYLTNSNGTTLVSDLYGAVSDGTFPSPLLTSISPSYIGTSGSYAIANANVVGDGGIFQSSLVSSFAVGAWTRTDLATSTSAAILWSYTAAQALVTDDQGLQVFPLGGGPAATIDPNGTYSGASLTADGATVVYATNLPTDGGMTNTLNRSPVASPSPAVLVSGPSLSVYTLSPNGQSVLSFGPPNLYVAHTAPPSTLLTVAPFTNTASPYFTGDSSHLVYLTNYNVAGSGSGTLNVMPAGGGAPTVLGQGVVGWAGSGPSKAVFNANYAIPFADIEVVDTATNAPPTVIVQQAHPSWGLSPAGDQVVYSWSAQLGSAAGIYVTPVP
jgi:hypothetical protein